MDADKVVSSSIYRRQSKPKAKKIEKEQFSKPKTSRTKMGRTGGGKDKEALRFRAVTKIIARETLAGS
jgi:hypothetical protein